MKKIFLIFSLLLFTGCNTNNTLAIEGTTENEIKACKLIKEFSLSRGSIQDYSDIKCEFIDEKMEDNSIPISIKHKDYQDVENKVLVDPENDMFVDINSRKIFIKEGNDFREMSESDVEKLLNENDKI